MSEWNEFCTKVGMVADKAAKKTGELADTASKHVRVKMYDAKLASKYEDLGRLTYRQLRTEVSQAEKIAVVVDKIDQLRAERKLIVTQIEEERAKRNAEKHSEKDAPMPLDEA